jgi:hypothetical protein
MRDVLLNVSENIKNGLKIVGYAEGESTLLFRGFINL